MVFALGDPHAPRIPRDPSPALMPSGSLLPALLCLPALLPHRLADESRSAPPPSGAPSASFDWLPLDDPEETRLPPGMRALPSLARCAYESRTSPSVFLARRIAPVAEVVEGFVADEEALVTYGELIPVEDGFLETELGEALELRCRWTLADVSIQVTAVYAPCEGATLALWLASTGDVTFDQQRAELERLLPRFQRDLGPVANERYEAILHGHELAFGLRMGAGEEAIQLTPVDEPRPIDEEFHEATVAVNPQFKESYARQWMDAEKGLSVSYQILQVDEGLGPKEPYVRLVASQIQDFERVDKELGDTPIELLHNPNAITRVVAQEDVERHYAANKRAPEDGVILKTYIPRSPFAEVCRLRWREAEEEEEALCLLVELRSYPRSRSETITRSCVVLLFARATDPTVLTRWENGLDFRCRPIDGPGPFAFTQ